jgi:[ribosomal protein S5]-alanine N-acetyltransferase
LHQVIPTFSFDHFNLREIRISDAQAWFSYLHNPQVTELTSYSINSVQDVERMLENYQAAALNQTEIRWAITLPESDILIGQISFYHEEFRRNWI